MESFEKRREQTDLCMTTNSKRTLEENETSDAVKKLKRDPDVLKMESRLSDDKLRQLTGFIGMEWEMLGTYLNFRYEEICKIRSRFCHDVDKAILTMLQQWRDKCLLDDMTKCNVLSKALRRVGRMDLAAKVAGNKL